MNFGEHGEVLYDMVKDPHQYTNVIDDPKDAETAKYAGEQLMLRLKEAR